MEDKVSVRWWNHRQAIYKAIRSLQNQETFADVILVCENKKFEAHKFVLSACSEFFEKELSEMPYRECFYLPAEIKERHFLSLLDYMYGGEAVVKEEEVNPLLKAAEILGIRGLAVPFYSDDDDDDDDDEEEEEESSNEGFEQKNERALICKQSKETVRKKKRSSETQTVISTLLDPSKHADFASCSILHDGNKSMNMNSTMSREKFSGNAEVPLREENATEKTQQNMDVNDMLTVLINGEQNANNFMNSEQKKLKGWSHGVKEEERIKDPKLVCPHCQRQFHWRSNLTKHIRTHTGEKPYTCSECDYKTGYSEALKRHTRTHTGEKPYECSLCDYKCKDGSSLKLHMNKHTGESSFSCSFCAYKTRIRTAYVKHMSTHKLQKDLKQEKVLEPPQEIPPPVSFDDFPCGTGF